jgi:acyl-CoA reductase-like NAD-dependent aldehyde dehydrogenase
MQGENSVSTLTQQQVDVIASRVLNLLKTPDSQSVEACSTTPETAQCQTQPGAFPTVDAAVNAARKAHDQLMTMTLAKRDEIIASIRKKMLEHAEDLGERAHAETGLGRPEDKLLKNRLVTEKTPGTEALIPTATSGDRGLTLMERAPYGVIGAITPSTNPTSTIICNTIGMVAAGNGVAFNVHPMAKEVSLRNVALINDAITEVGGPPNLVTTVAEPTVESAQELMKHPGVRLLVVTGGAGVVKAAMTSGKRAICAGPGNPPAVVDETADIENAAKSIVLGGSMDNNIICVDEKEVFVVESVADQLVSALSKDDAVVLNPDQIQQVENVIFAENRGPRKPAVMEKSLVGKNVGVILSRIGMQVEDRIRLAVLPVDQDHPLVWSEQMMPVMPVVRMPNADSAIDIAQEAEHGFKHTAVMHSRNLDNLSRMARVMNCSIFVKNGPAVAGLGYGGEGYSSFSIASPTGEGMTDPRSFSRERRCVLVDHFRIV